VKLSDFDYSLPSELIAQYPLKERDSCRLLIVRRKDKTLEHRVFREVADCLRKEDLLVLNDTQVLPARLLGRRKTGGRVEALLINKKNGLTFEAWLKPGRLKIDEEVIFNGGSLKGIISAKNEIIFQAKSEAAVYRQGVMPLPPYIRRPAEPADNLTYQTVYARNKGAIASPTAGLHFTKGLLGKIKARGVDIASITLHTSFATFKPVEEEDIRRHKMGKEYFKVGKEAQAQIKRARQARGRIIACGTTTCRTLETYARGKSQGDTDLFIYPGFAFRLTDGLLTNFHLPRTTLFMLVCAFAGEKLLKRAYAEAVARKYRFYSYGDAMLIV
jgi:S-adenosylmethionine:tRNA ribosyltransferase-isomerase